MGRRERRGRLRSRVYVLARTYTGVHASSVHSLAHIYIRARTHTVSDVAASSHSENRAQSPARTDLPLHAERRRSNRCQGQISDSLPSLSIRRNDERLGAINRDSLISRFFFTKNRAATVTKCNSANFLGETTRVTNIYKLVFFVENLVKTAEFSNVCSR